MTPGRWQMMDPDRVVHWTPASPPRVIEGPLGLDVFADRALILNLVAGQLAVHTVDGRVRRTYLDGRHRLEVAEEGGHLVFVRTDVPIRWRWGAGADLRLDLGAAAVADIPLRGSCSLEIVDPIGFHQRVLAGVDHCDDQRLIDAFDAFVRSSLEARLVDLVGRGAVDELQAKVRLEALDPGALEDDLAPLGLACRRLEVAVPLGAEGFPATHEAPAIASYDDVL